MKHYSWREVKEGRTEKQINKTKQTLCKVMEYLELRSNLINSKKLKSLLMFLRI
jgi:hypothetical protein